MSETKKPKTNNPPPKKRRANLEPDWSNVCHACGAKPVLPVTGLCGPCTFGDADTSGGNW